jgi:protein O-mannosyl-transferase
MSSQPHRSRDSWAAATLLAAGVATTTALAFVRCLSAGFITLDDAPYVLNNPRVLAGLTWDGVVWAWTTHYASNWHPLVWMSLMLDRSLFGPSAWGFHLTNIVLHAANAALLFLALRTMTGDSGRSAFVALVFGLHPLRLESVAWIAERKDVLSGLFWFLCVWCYAVRCTTGSRWAWGGCVASFAAGLCAKQILVTLPCVLVLLDLWPLGRWSGRVWGSGGTLEHRDDRRSLVALIAEKWVLFALVLLASWAVVQAQSAGGAMSDFQGIPLSERLRNAITAYGLYLWLTVWPVPLSVYFPYEYANFGWGGAGLSLLVLMGLTGLAVRNWSRTPALLVGWLWYLGTMVPVIGLIQVGQQSLACRYTYISGVGLALALAWGLPLPQKADLRWVGRALATACLMLLGGCTVWQSGYWHDTVTLMQRALEVTENNVVGHLLLGGEQLRRRELDAARENLLAAARIDTRSDFGAMAWHQLGRLAEAQKQFAEAETCHRRAIEQMPDMALAHEGLGSIIVAQVLTKQADPRRLEEARTCLERAVELEPNSFATRYSLSLIYMLSGKLDLAEQEVRAALKINGASTEARALLEGLQSRPRR